MIPFSRSMTFASTAAASASGAIPARSRSENEGAPSAEASLSASRVAAGRPASLAPTSSSSVSGTGSGWTGSTCAPRAWASSSAKNGFPPEVSWIRSSVWRANGLPTRSRRKRWSAPTLSGPTNSRWTRSGSSARSRAEGCARFDDPPGEQQSHALAGHTSQREHKRARRGRVEPLDVVDGEHDRRLCGERLQGVRTATASVRGSTGSFESLVQEQRHLERAPSRCRQGGQNLVEHALEEVTEHDVRERALGLGRARREDAETLLVRFLDPRTPKRGLPDPRLALEHERPRSSRLFVQEGTEGAELLLPAHDLESHRPPSNGDRGC